jgi:hypothetical protein
MSPEPITPRAVANLFKLLPPEGQKEYLEQLRLTAEGLFLLLHQVSPQEQYRFTEMIFGEIIWKAFPWLVQHAIEVVKQHPQASNDELYTLINEATKRSVEAYQVTHTELAKAQLKEKRDPKPRKTDRDEAIVRLRDEEKKTFGEIPRLLLKLNPLWCGIGGKPMSRDAVEAAYRRRKGLGTK